MSTETTIDGLIEAQRLDIHAIDERLRKRQRSVTRKALELQDKTLARTSLGSWGAATRQRVLIMLGHGARGLARAQATDLGVGIHGVVNTSQQHASRWLTTMDRAYLGVEHRLAWNTAAWAQATGKKQVKTRLRVFHGSFARYGGAVVAEIEKALGSLPVGASWEEVREKIGRAAREQVEDKAWMVDRIVRTEVSHAYSATTQRALMAENSRKNPMGKKLVAIFDLVTGADSYMLDGQIRPVKEPFYDAFHGFDYMHPPNRPNDREIMVGWRLSWGSDRKAAGRRARTKRVEVVEPDAVKAAKKRQRTMAAAFEAVKTMEATLAERSLVPTTGLEGAALARAAGHNLAAQARKKAVEDEKKAVRRRARKPAQAPKAAPARAKVPASVKPKAAPKAAPSKADKATNGLTKEIKGFEKDREALLKETGALLGDDGRARLAELQAREMAATKGKRGVTPSGRVVKDTANSQAQRDAWVASLTKEERAAVYDWSTEQWYGQMRMVDSGREAAASVRDVVAGRRAEAELTVESRRKIVAFREALAKAPRYEGEVSRGLRDLPRSSALRKALDVEGAVIELDAVSSWSSDQWAARGFAADDNGSYLLVVKTKRGAVISDSRTVVVQAEAEVMIDKGARFKVVSTKKRKGDMKRRIVVLEEIEPE